MNIDQDLLEDWPFVVFDHDHITHEIVMKPQDLVLYEASSFPHSRPYPLNRNSYANAFIHFKLKTWTCPF